MKVQDVMDSSIAYKEYALTATESIDELMKVIESMESQIEDISRELAAANMALNRMDEADRKLHHD